MVVGARGLSFPGGLQDGVVLCRLANAVTPGAVPVIHEFSEADHITDPGVSFKRMDNITNAIKSFRAFGVREHELFSTVVRRVASSRPPRGCRLRAAPPPRARASTPPPPFPLRHPPRRISPRRRTRPPSLCA